MRGEKKDTFHSHALISPPAEMSILLGLVWWGGGIKNTPRPKTTYWSETGGGNGGSSQKTPNYIGEGGDKSHPQPNTLKHPNVTKDELCGPHSSTLLLDD